MTERNYGFSDQEQKSNRGIEIVKAVIMAFAMGTVSSVIVSQTPGRSTPPFPILCLLNCMESLVVTILIACFIPLEKIGKLLAEKISSRSDIRYSLVYSIPPAIGYSLIASAAVSFFNILMAHLRMPPDQAPRLVLMWLSSWVPLLMPLTLITYVIYLVITLVYAKKNAPSGTKPDTEKRMKRFQIELLIVFAMIVIGVTFVVDLVVVDRSESVIKSKVSDLIAANSRQIVLNINSYMERMQTTPTLLFSDEIYYGYDPVNDELGEYEKVKREELIYDRIVDIGLMNNYLDFGIVYSDGHKIGWISNGTQGLFPGENIYDAFASLIGDNAKEESWAFGIGGSNDRIFYIKRLNENALILTSVYTRELTYVFVYPEQLDDMIIRLTGQNGTIVFSSLPDEAGKHIPSELSKMIDLGSLKAGDSRTIAGDDYFLNTDVCANGWRVLCSVPANIILEEIDNLSLFTIRISVIMAIIFVLIGLLLIRRVSLPMDDLVLSLQYKAEIDRLSGVMNKAAFQEEVEKRLLPTGEANYRGFVMMDMDNFKQANDMLGHSYGDQVIIHFGKLLKNLYSSDTVIGRLGGDEFALYMEAGEEDFPDKEAFTRSIKDSLEKVWEGFLKEFAAEREKCNLSISAGIYAGNNAETVFSDLYEKADSALYASKNNGKQRYTVYEEEKP